jgi:hypothetical protein
MYISSKQLQWTVASRQTNTHQNSPVFANTQIILVPVFQGGIMQMNDNRPPFSIKSKAPPSSPSPEIY